MSHRSFIKSELVEIGDTYNDVTERHRFAMWVMATYHYSSDFSAGTLQDVYDRSVGLLGEEGKPGDEDLDGYFFDKEMNTLYLYQSKWPDSAKKKSNKKDAQEIALAANALLDDTLNGNPMGDCRRAASEALKTIMDENGSIVLRAVSGSKWTKDYSSDIEKILDSQLKKRAEVEIIDSEKLIAFISAKSEDLSDREVEFELYPKTTDAQMHYPAAGSDGIGDSLVALITGVSLGIAANQYGTRLFDKNVRTFLGRGRVNKSIIDALEEPDQRRKFWYGHNGITILCDDYQLAPNQNNAKSVKVKNPQIVNGCQTASSIGHVIKNGEICAEDFAILARILKLEGETESKQEASGYVAFGTNNQSPISDADLMSNDPRQIFFEKMLRSYSNSWYYERKTKGWKNLPRNRKKTFKSSGQADRIIARDAYQQAWRSFTGDPKGAISDKNHVWDKSKSAAAGDLYGKVFDKERRPCDVILVCTLSDWFTQLFKMKQDGSLCLQINKSLKEYLPRISQARTLVAAHTLALFGELVKEEYGDITGIDPEKIEHLSSCLDRGRYVEKNWSQKSWLPIEKSVKLILKTWTSFLVSAKQTEEHSGETLYIILKKGEALPVLIETMEGMMDDDAFYLDSAFTEK